MRKTVTDAKRRKQERIVKEFHKNRLSLKGIERAESMTLEAYQVLQELLVSLRKRRKEAGRSLEDIAEISGIDKGYLSRLENGRVLNPTFETVYRYAAAIGPVRSMKDLLPA